MFDLTDKVVVITGGAGKLGQKHAEAVAEFKAVPILLDLSLEQAEIASTRITKEYGVKSLGLEVDITNESQVVQCCQNLLNEFGKIDVLINNAGVNKIDSIDKIEEDDWDWINHVNLRGPFLLTKAVSEIMKKKGQGKIVNISSIFGEVSKPKRVAYSTTKWGLIGFTKAVALDLAPYNILVNAVSPGFVDTQLTRSILGEKGIKEITETIPQKRLATVEEIAKTVVFLASDHNTYITGQNIIVDGGFTSA